MSDHPRGSALETTDPGKPRPAPGSDLERIRSILPTLIDALTDAVRVLDREQRVVAVNRRYVEAFGAGCTAIGHLACYESAECADGCGDAFQQCPACEVLRSRKPLHRMREVSDGRGGQSRWEGTFSPAFGPHGEITHVVDVWRDAADHRQLEAQLAHSERLAAIGVLAAGVGHEINNPLASMMMGVEVLARGFERGRFDEQHRSEALEVLGMLDKAILQCRDTTRKLMMLAQPYATAPTLVSLNQVVLDTLSLLHYEMHKHAVTSVEQLDPELPELWARDSGMRGVCMNLLMNAVQAMPTGGTLTVSTARAAESVVLTVADTGTGIAAEILDRIWEPFFSTKPMGQGTGLGLAITQRVVTRHGGTIRVESAPGKGARFVVRLPIQGPAGE